MTRTIALARGLEIGILKDPAAWLTHLVGFFAAIVGLVALAYASAGDTPRLTTMVIYNSTLVGLFGASCLYHFFDLGDAGNRWLRRLDHVAIFLLIAGTYAPFFLYTLDGTWRLAMFWGVGGIAVIGSILKLVWIDMPRKVSTLFYVALGWAVIIPGPTVAGRLSFENGAWFVGGGLVFSAGAIIYARKRPDPWPGVFGFHEMWHLFVLGGAACHWVGVYTLIDRSYPGF